MAEADALFGIPFTRGPRGRSAGLTIIGKRITDPAGVAGDRRARPARRPARRDPGRSRTSASASISRAASATTPARSSRSRCPTWQRQPRRRRSLRRPRRHVRQEAGPRGRLLARPRAHPRRHGGAQDVPGALGRPGAAAVLDGRGARGRCSAWPGSCARRGSRSRCSRRRRKLGKQLQYADAPGVKAPLAAILGEEELAAGELTLKHLGSGEQTRVRSTRQGPRSGSCSRA
jgi:hypothetical protein